MAKVPVRSRGRKAGKSRGTAAAGPQGSEESPPHTLSHLPPSAAPHRTPPHFPVGDGIGQELSLSAHPCFLQSGFLSKWTLPGRTAGNISVRNCKITRSGQDNTAVLPA